jgi:valyl-tRNA synthetase
MSKSLGTGVDPLDLIAKHGADATRYGLLKMSSTQDVRFAEGMIEEGRALCNKLWNAARLILLNADADAEDESALLEPVDAWILGRLADSTGELTSALDSYDFAAAVKALYRFVWNDVCDWYLEAAKVRLYGDDPAARQAVSQTLLYVLQATLRLAHPVLPHVTERIWGDLGGQGVLARGSWPEVRSAGRNPDTEQAVEQAFACVALLRRLRADAELAPRAPLALALPGGSQLEPVAPLVASLAGVEIVRSDGSGVPLTVGDTTVHVQAPGLAEALRPRLERRLAEAEAEAERARRKLTDTRFVERAPEHLVEEEREKAERFEREATELRARLADLGA